MARRARADADVAARTCFVRSCESGFCLLALRRVDLRDGRARESSSMYDAFFAAALDMFRAAVEPPPAFRSVALTPGWAVSTGRSRRRRSGRFGRFGANRSCWYLNSSALVATASPESWGRGRFPSTPTVGDASKTIAHLIAVISLMPMFVSAVWGCGTFAPVGVSINPENIARDVVVVGASAGGVRAVIEILSRLPADLPAFMGIVIHRGADSTSSWAGVLGMKTKLRVVEPTHGDSLARGFVYIAPADCHMTFEDGRIALDGGSKEHHARPAVDPLFTSAARDYGPRVVAVVLTGGGHDGMQGLRDVTMAGGLSLVQKPSEAEHASMPQYAIAHDHVRAELTVDEIGDALVLLARGGDVPLAAGDAPSA